MNGGVEAGPACLLLSPSFSVNKMGMMINQWRESDFPGLWGNCRGTEHHDGAARCGSQTRGLESDFPESVSEGGGG